MNPFSYENSISEVEERLKKDAPAMLHYEIQFLSGIDTGYPENSIVKGEYYQPKVEGKIPLAILVHGMGDHSVIPCKLLAGSLLKQGIACFIPYLTLHSKRIPKVMRAHLPYLNPDEWFQCYQVSITDIRQIVDWASGRTELDAGQVSVLGISFGGFVSSIVMGIDARIKSGIFMVTGGNSNKISWLNGVGQYRKRYRRTEAEHLEIQESYAQYLKDVAENGFENVVTDNQSFLTDPLTFAGYLKGRPVLMINARWDKYIPRETVTEFWQACGQPEIKWIPSGHTSIWLWYPAIRNSVVAFLKSSLYLPGDFA
ncbi:alpha/beta hydrolase family protein [Chloroflexota bacterium]